jgi:protein-S-isoprenylcysteine O-methyltransferase Ste14
LLRAMTLVYGVAVYLVFLAGFALLVAFVADVPIVRGIDSGGEASLPEALAIDLALVAQFGVAHSVMARPGFKARERGFVPEVAERSTYVLVATVQLLVLVLQWQAIPAVVWSVRVPAARTALWVASGGGVALLVFATFLTDHFDLFGLRQVWLYAREEPYAPVPFETRSLYRYVRHPMMIGVLLWFWATPTMSVGHLVFALGMTAYVIVGVHYEERDLARRLGDAYRSYRDEVRAFLPGRRRR